MPVQKVFNYLFASKNKQKKKQLIIEVGHVYNKMERAIFSTLCLYLAN